MKLRIIPFICVSIVMALLFTSCGKNSAAKDHVSHQVNRNTKVSDSDHSNADASVDLAAAPMSWCTLTSNDH